MKGFLKILPKVILRQARASCYPVYAFFYGMFFVKRFAADARTRKKYCLARCCDAIEARKSSDTLFVLGSGTSINEMTDRMWDEIKAANSIGFNNWMLHSFIPTYYMRESKSNYRANPEFLRLIKAKCKQYASTPMVLRGFKDQERDDMLGPREFPEALRSNLCMPLHLDVPAGSEDELRTFLRLWRRLGFLFWRDVHLSCRASLSTLIYIGVIHGYRHIVLCGIDLNDSRYFWQDWTDVPPEYDLVPVAAEGERHKTLNPDLGLPIDLVVRVFQEELLKPLGISLHVASGTSALAAFLPVFEPDAA